MEMSEGQDLSIER